jgi:hypothetical protein
VPWKVCECVLSACVCACSGGRSCLLQQRLPGQPPDRQAALCMYRCMLLRWSRCWCLGGGLQTGRLHGRQASLCGQPYQQERRQDQNCQAARVEAVGLAVSCMWPPCCVAQHGCWLHCHCVQVCHQEQAALQYRTLHARLDYRQAGTRRDQAAMLQYLRCSPSCNINSEAVGLNWLLSVRDQQVTLCMRRLHAEHFHRLKQVHLQSLEDAHVCIARCCTADHDGTSSEASRQSPATPVAIVQRSILVPDSTAQTSQHRSLLV